MRRVTTATRKDGSSRSRGIRVDARYVFPGASPCLSKDRPDTVALGTKLLEGKAGAVVPGEGFQAPGLFGLSFETAFAGLQEGALRIADFTASKCSTYQRR